MKEMKEFVNEALDTLDNNIDDNTGFLWTGGSEAQVIAHMLLEELETDVTFLTIDTGNQFDSVYEFREEFAENNDFEWRVKTHDDLLEVINDDDDPRDYHGEWQCGLDKEVDIDPDDWTVERSCGQLKVVPLREYLEEGYEKLITGVRGDDPLIGIGDDFGPVVERKSPITHTRINPLHDWDEEHVWAYLQFHFVDYPDVYDEGVRHTDAQCCVNDDAVSEHNPEGFDPQLNEKREALRDMGYV